MGAHAAARGRVPPMLDVAFAELVSGSPQQMLARQARFGMDQRHYVLQLVAETIRAAGLIEARSPPKPAAQRLIQQPAVGHHIYGRIGRFDVHSAEGAVPITPNAFQFGAAGIAPPKPLDEMAYFRGAASHPEAKSRFARLALRELKTYL